MNINQSIYTTICEFTKIYTFVQITLVILLLIFRRLELAFDDILKPYCLKTSAIVLLNLLFFK